MYSLRSLCINPLSLLIPSIHGALGMEQTAVWCYNFQNKFAYLLSTVAIIAIMCQDTWILQKYALREIKNFKSAWEINGQILLLENMANII